MLNRTQYRNVKLSTHFLRNTLNATRLVTSTALKYIHHYVRYVNNYCANEDFNLSLFINQNCGVSCAELVLIAVIQLDTLIITT